MVMNRMRWIQMVAVMIAALLCASTSAPAEDQSDTNAELLETIKALQGEVAAIQAELKAMRTELGNVRKELAAVKKAGKPPKKQPKVADTTVYDIPIGSSPVLGPKDAPVTITEFACLECPFCIREAPQLEKVLAEYPNDVKLVYKHFPLRFHKNAKPVHATLVLAAQKSNETFWQLHDLIVDDGLQARKEKKRNPALQVPNLRTHAEAAGLNLEEFDALMDDPEKMDALLAEDLALAKKCKVNGTPTIMINGLKLSGRRSMELYKTRIDEVLKEKGGK